MIYIGGKYGIVQENTVFTENEFDNLADEEILTHIDESQLKGT